MRARTAPWVAGGIAAGSIALMAGGLALAYVDRHLVPADRTSWDFSDIFSGVENLAIPVVGFVLASRRPANRIGWLFLAVGLALGLSRFADQYGLRALVADPGSLPAARAVIWLSNWIWMIPLAVVAFMFMLFPTGRLRSRRWRPAGWFVGVVFTLATVAVLVGATRTWSHPFSGSFGQAVTPLVLTALLVLLPAALVVSLVAVVVRFARSSGEERLQLKWFAVAALLVVAAFIAVILTNSVAANVLVEPGILVPAHSHRHRGAEVPAV